MLDAKWVDALKLPLTATLALAFSSIVFLVLLSRRVLSFGQYDEYARPILIVTSVLFSILATLGTAEVVLAPLRERRRSSLLAQRRAVRRHEKRQDEAERHTAVLARLEHLSREEIRYVVDCLERGTPTFYTYVHSPAVSVLLGKGLVWNPGTQHNQDHYPFSFHDFVWEELLRRRDEFIAKEEAFREAEKMIPRHGR